MRREKIPSLAFAGLGSLGRLHQPVLAASFVTVKSGAILDPGAARETVTASNAPEPALAISMPA
jgi:hypothetical protein